MSIPTDDEGADPVPGFAGQAVTAALTAALLLGARTLGGPGDRPPLYALAVAAAAFRGGRVAGLLAGAVAVGLALRDGAVGRDGPARSAAFAALAFAAAMWFGAGRWRRPAPAPAPAEPRRPPRAEPESGVRYRSLAEAIPQMAWASRPDGYVDDFNRQWYDYTGLSPGASAGWGWGGAVHPDDLGPMTELWREALARGEAAECEARFRRAADGSHRWHLVRAVPVRDDAGRVVRWFGTSTDIDDLKRSEQDLRMSEARFRALVDQSPLSTQVLGADGVTLRVNHAWEQLFGVTLDQIRGYNVLQDDQLRERGQMPLVERAFAGEGSVIPPNEFVPPFGPRAGESIWLRSFIYPVKDGRGAVREVVLVHEDITERVRAEEALRRQHAFTGAVTRSMAEGLFALDPGGLVTFMNPAAERMLGWAAGEVSGRPMAAVLRPRAPGAPGEDGPLAEALRARAEARGEGVFVRKDGTEFLASFASSPIDGADGEGGVVLTFHDITRRRRAEDDLRASERQLRAVFESSRDAIVLADDEGRYVEVNPAACALFGVAREGLIGRAIADFAEAAYPVAAAWSEFRGDGLSRGEFRVVRPDGSVRDAEYAATADVLPGRHLSVLRDVTDRKRAEDELRQARDAAERADRAKDQFLAVLSHELRNPLTPVLVSASALLDDPETPDSVRPALEVTRRNVQLEARLIDDLLDVTRIRQGKLRLETSVVDAHALVRQAVEICRDEIAGSGHDLTLDLSASRFHVEADPARLQQVAWNLIKNAAKFTPKGGSIAVRSRDKPGPGGPRLVVEVADTGVGIGPDALPKIFDAFEQGDPSVTRQFGGLGLGLAISRSLAEALGGSLSAHSPGKGLGATFTLTLPAVPAPVAASAGPSVDDPGAVTPPLAILLVEDNRDTLRVMARLLRGRGHRVTTAESVAEGLDAAGSGGPFDLVVSDIGLPDGSGLDLMRQVRAGSGARGIALSGYGMEDDLRKSWEAGFVAHLTKPVDFARLEATIRRVALAEPRDDG